MPVSQAVLRFERPSSRRMPVRLPQQSGLLMSAANGESAYPQLPRDLMMQVYLVKVVHEFPLSLDPLRLAEPCPGGRADRRSRMGYVTANRASPPTDTVAGAYQLQHHRVLAHASRSTARSLLRTPDRAHLLRRLTVRGPSPRNRPPRAVARSDWRPSVRRLAGQRGPDTGLRRPSAVRLSASARPNLSKTLKQF